MALRAVYVDARAISRQVYAVDDVTGGLRVEVKFPVNVAVMVPLAIF